MNILEKTIDRGIGNDEAKGEKNEVAWQGVENNIKGKKEKEKRKQNKSKEKIKH